MCIIYNPIGETYLKEAIAVVLCGYRKQNYLIIENYFSFPQQDYLWITAEDIIMLSSYSM